jgi:hypothetical protein
VADAAQARARVATLVAGGSALLLVLCRIRLVAVFGGSWTDEDQTLLWFAARDLGTGHLREPYFFGQPYGSWLEALVAVPLRWVGVPFRLALPIAGSMVGTLPWLLFAAVAGWARRAPWLATAILAAGTLMAVEGSIVTTMPRGLLPGIALGCVAVCLAVTWPSSAVALAGFGFLLVVSASLNVGAGLVTGPVAVWVVLDAVSERRDGWVRGLGALGGGLVAGALVHVAAQHFYAVHPAADLHGTPAFSFSVSRMVENLGHLGRYLTAYAPEAWRSWLAVAVAVVAVTVAVVVRHRTLAATAAAVTAVALAVGALGTAKANDGVASIFFPFARVYLGLPWMLCGLALLPTRRERPSSVGVSRSATVVGLALALVVIGLAAVGQVRLHGRAGELVAAADGVPPVAPVSTSHLARSCALRRAMATTHRADVVIDRYDRSATYGCGALLGDEVPTLFPEYERRTWLLQAAAHRRVGRVLVSGLDGCPPAIASVSCELLDARERLYLLSGAPRPVTTWARDAGLPVRRF